MKSSNNKTPEKEHSFYLCNVDKMFTGVAFQLNVSSSSSFAFSLKISCIWLLIIEMIDLVFCGTFSEIEKYFLIVRTHERYNEFALSIM